MRNALFATTLAVCLTGISYAQTTYQYDDGVSNVTFGPPSSFEPFGDIDILWGNYFFTNDPTELVTEVSFGLGELSAGGNVSIWIFDDPDNDADPTNAVPVFSMQTVGQNLGFDFNVQGVTPTAVSGGFFVAIGHLAVLTYPDGNPDYPSPGRFDPDARADRSWFFYDNDIPEQDLGSSGFFTRMDGPQVPIPGAFAIRATTVPEPAAAILLGLATLILRRR
jgi:hypothetical protein